VVLNLPSKPKDATINPSAVLLAEIDGGADADEKDEATQHIHKINNTTLINPSKN
jgi:tellurite resistance protein